MRKDRIARYTIGAILLVGLAKTAFETAVRPLGNAPPGYGTCAPPGQWANLMWEDLVRGQWTPGKQPVLPTSASAMAGRRVKLAGSVLPLHQAAEASEFILARAPSGCYFCNPPGISEVVMIRHKGGRKLPPTDKPVFAYGVFRTATGRPDDQMLYTIDDAIITLAQ